MSLILLVDDTCPKCRDAIMQFTIEPDPARHDRAFHNLYCPHCGPIQTKIITLRLDVTAPELAA